MPSIIGLDIETSKLPNSFPWKPGYYLSCISLSFHTGQKLTWFFEHDEYPDATEADYMQNFAEIQNCIDHADIVAAHNAKFELNNLRRFIKFKKIFCTQVGQYLLNYHSNKDLNLNSVAQAYGLSAKLDKVKVMWDAGYDTREVPADTLAEYCEDDAEKARKLAEMMIIRLQGRGLMKVFELQMEWLNVLSEMETNGMLWDMAESKRILAKYKRYNNILDRTIIRYIKPYINGHEVNLGSKDDLSAILYGGALKRKVPCPVIKTKNIKVKMPYIFTYKNGKQKIKVKFSAHPDTQIIRRVLKDKLYPIDGLGCRPVPKTELKRSTADHPLYKTDKDTLPSIAITKPIQNKIIKLLLHKSKLAKVVATFHNEEKNTGLISKIAMDGRLHTNYNQTVTATGRLSSSDPNSQNLPRGNTSPIKCCIIPEFDGIMNADVSQIELRVPAQLSGDVVMVKEFQDGEDLHTNCCVKSMKLKKTKTHRVYAKIFNFRMIYGGTEWGFFKDPKMPDWKIGRWKDVIKAWYERYTGIDAWQQGNIKHVIDGDGTLVLPTGRSYKFKVDHYGKYDERKIKNYPVQGLAGGDLLPLAGVIIYKAMKKRKMKSKMIMTVHDSIVFDYVKSEEKALSDLCLRVFKSLPKYVKQYWGVDWVVPIEGETEIGNNYGSMKFYAD